MQTLDGDTALGSSGMKSASRTLDERNDCQLPRLSHTSDLWISSVVATLPDSCLAARTIVKQIAVSRVYRTCCWKVQQPRRNNINSMHSKTLKSHIQPYD